MDSKIATLEFSYKANLKMDEEDRIENPLGFQVTSYRVDNDYATSPPLEATPGMQSHPAGFIDPAFDGTGTPAGVVRTGSSPAPTAANAN